MQPRTLEQVLSELNGTFDPQAQLLRQRQADIPNQTAADEQGLKAQEQNYYDTTIMGDARRRGIAFGGIPLGERAQYGATTFLPALAHLKQQGKDQAMSLEDAILQLQERKRTMGQNIYQGEQSLFENRRQFDAQQALEREKMAQAQQAAAAQAAANNAWMTAFQHQQSQPTDYQSLLDHIFGQSAAPAAHKAVTVGPSVPVGPTAVKTASNVLQAQPAYGAGGFRNVSTGFAPLKVGF